jgi:hypothetical protein
MKGQKPLENLGKLLTFIAGTNNGINADDLLSFLYENGLEKFATYNSYFGTKLPPSRLLGLLNKFENEVVKSKCSKPYKDLVALAKSKPVAIPQKNKPRNTMISGYKDHKTVTIQKPLPKDFIRGGRTQ